MARVLHIFYMQKGGENMEMEKVKIKVRGRRISIPWGHVLREGEPGALCPDHFDPSEWVEGVDLDEWYPLPCEVCESHLPWWGEWVRG